MSRPKWQVNLIKRFFDKIFIFAHITKIPILGNIIFKTLFNKDDITYIPINQSIPQPDNLVLASDIIRHFIKKSEYRWISNECICRSSNKCSDYPIDLGCIYLGEAVKEFHPALGRMVSVEKALSHIDKCEKAGLIHMIGLSKMDSILLNCTPAKALMTICNCCECCCFFRIIPFLNKPISNNIKKLNDINIAVNEDCTGCGLCVDVCMVRAISISSGYAEVSDNCIGCGKCVINCPSESISLNILNTQFIDNSIDMIAKNIEV